jgi:hypothetical protein
MTSRHASSHGKHVCSSVYVRKETASKVTIFNCNKFGKYIFFLNFCLNIYWSYLIKQLPGHSCLTVGFPIGKGNGKGVPLHAMEALGGRGGIAPIYS